MALLETCKSPTPARTGSAGRLSLPLVYFLIFSLCFLTGCGGRENDGVTDGAGGRPVVSGQVPAVLLSPELIESGGPLRVLASFEQPAGRVEIEAEGPEGEYRPLKIISGGGPPYWVAALFGPAAAGRHEVRIKSSGQTVFRMPVNVAGPKASDERRRGEWRSRKGWSRTEELLYSAWLEALFSGADERSSWPALHAVTQNSEANLLYNHLGAGEDDAGRRQGLRMEPDCADNPYFLRAYFSWKLGLPFGFHRCDRGRLHLAPVTGKWLTNDSPVFSRRGAPIRSFERLLALTADAVHAGSARTALDDSDSDYYPLPLDRQNLRPGTVYADPYGHTLVIVRWVAQRAKEPGKLLAVDAQPDGTIGIKRFWKGNFLFETEEVIGEPGFKWFRPIVLENGRARLLTNDEIGASPDYGNVSLEQRKMTADEFYALMEKLINPKVLDPVRTLRDLFTALHEQLLVRVESVANGENYIQSRPGTVIPMPSNQTGVFQAMGLWEDYSTPNRDLRLLIAIDAVLEFPEMVSREPDRYLGNTGMRPAEVVGELKALADRLAGEMTIKYTRSDGSPWELTLAEVMERRQALEMAYNPNDSVEIRWGAPGGSEEIRTARRRAPAGQRARMEALRSWFRKRLHPPT